MFNRKIQSIRLMLGGLTIHDVVRSLSDTYILCTFSRALTVYIYSGEFSL